MEEGEANKEEINLEELENWFKIKTDKIFSDLDDRIKEIKGRIKEEVAKTKDNLALLSAAQLHNPNISVRETQFMGGNRSSYILGVNSLLRAIELDEIDHYGLLEFCNDFDSRLEKFGKSTFRSYHILQEFFAHESRNIAINIKNIDSSIKELRISIENANVNKIDEIKRDITNLNNRIKQKDEIGLRLKDKEKEKEELVKNKENIEKNADEVRKGKEYKKLEELKANKEILLAAVRDHNAKIVHAFSVMERPLKKMIKVVVEDGDLLERYIENPINTLISDNELKIVVLLNKLENNITNLTLELKDKKREKVLETIKGLTESYIKEFVNEHNELNKKLENLEKEINENEALKKENKLNYELEDVNNSLEEIGIGIESNKAELEKININEMKEDIAKKINEILKINVAIS